MNVNPGCANLRRAHAEALRCLARRDHSCAEIFQYLTRKGFAAETIEAAVAKISDQGLLDDRKFASNWVAARVRSAPRSRRLLALELQRRGVDAATAQGALTDLDDFRLALACIRRRARQWQAIPESHMRGLKILRHLQYKGFALGVSRAAMQSYLGGEIPDEGGDAERHPDLDI